MYCCTVLGEFVPGKELLLVGRIGRVPSSLQLVKLMKIHTLPNSQLLQRKFDQVGEL
jgi:hypothetical protein